MIPPLRSRVIGFWLWGGTLIAALALTAGVFAGFVHPPAGARSDSSAKLSSAQSALDAGEYAAAETYLVSLLADDPDHRGARRLYARALDVQSHNPEAIGQYRIATDADPADHESLYRMAVLERLIGRASDATEHFERAYAVERMPEYADELARTYLQVGRTAEAIAIWERALESTELAQDVRVRMLGALASAYESERDFEGARGALIQAAVLRPGDDALRARLDAIGVSQ